MIPDEEAQSVEEGDGLKVRGLKPKPRLLAIWMAVVAAAAGVLRWIQELAGHEDLATTQSYVHLSPAAIDAAIRLLDNPANTFGGSNNGEAGSTEIANVSR